MLDMISTAKVLHVLMHGQSNFTSKRGAELLKNSRQQPSQFHRLLVAAVELLC